MKQLLFLTLITLFILSGCANQASPESSKEQTISVTDSAGNEVALSSAPQKTIALTASLADVWQLAGGDLIAVTNDAFKTEKYDKEKITDIGTVKEPNMELILSLEADFVILSADIPGQSDLAATLDKAGISYFIAEIEGLGDYLSVLKSFTDITGRTDLYKQNGEDVEKEINSLLERIPEGSNPTALFLRAHSSGVKAISQNNATCEILKNIGTINIAERQDSLLEDLSMEVITMEDPDFIFVVTMGDDSKKAMNSLNESLASSPAWGELSAIKENRLIILPQDLFHYKPNERWGEAYEYLLGIIYPEIFEAN